jgi:serralysin
VSVLTAGAFFAGQEALAKVLIGTGGEDTLVGTDMEDRLTGRGGQPQGSPRADRLQGSLGADHPKGNRGNDRLWGSGGNDKIIPGDGNDKVYAGRGDDLIYARDTDGVDFIDCGPGFDKVETIHRHDVTLSNRTVRASRHVIHPPPWKANFRNIVFRVMDRQTLSRKPKGRSLPSEACRSSQHIAAA